MAKTRQKYRIGFIGAGKMARALIEAILRKEIADKKEVICSDPIAAQTAGIKEKLGIAVACDNKEVLSNAKIVVLAFKPQNFPEAIAGLEKLVQPDQIIISILAGVRIERIEEYLPGKVVRVMPNTACLVGQMAAGYAATENVSDEDLKQVNELLESAGVAVQVSEDQMDAVTGLSGSGPAFVAYLIESFIQAGVSRGLNPQTARMLSLQTFSGTARLLAERNMTPRELIDMVSSPNGTTVAGRRVLESSDIREIIIKTIHHADQRSRELGQ